MDESVRPSRPTGDTATEDDIYFVYRLILQRLVEPKAMERYRQLYVERGVPINRLVFDFMNSDEYRKNFGADSPPVEVDMGGYRVVVRKSEIDFGKSIAAGKTHETHVCNLFREYIRKGDTVVDVGANVGVMTFLTASLVGDQGQVFAIEPNPANLQLLYRGILVNGFSNVRILPYAASDAFGVLALSLDTSNTRVINVPPPGRERSLVQTIRLDEQLAGLSAINFVKMDVEGHEPRVLAGFWNLITRHRPVLVTEFNPNCLKVQNQDPLSFLRQLFALYPQVRVTSAFQDDATFKEPEPLMKYWETRGQELAKNIPSGAFLHFDLIATP